MTLGEIKRQVFTLIEEYDDSDESMTSDEDFAAKINNVVNLIQNELSRVKKIPFYLEKEVNKDDIIEMSEISEEIDQEVYQLKMVKGVEYELKADGTIIKIKEDGTAEIEGYKYPKQINELTEDDYEFDLSIDVLEIMPFGVAGDLLKSDVSNGYGNIYSQRYEAMKNAIDIRYNQGTIKFGEVI